MLSNSRPMNRLQPKLVTIQSGLLVDYRAQLVDNPNMDTSPIGRSCTDRFTAAPGQDRTIDFRTLRDRKTVWCCSQALVDRIFREAQGRPKHYSRITRDRRPLELRLGTTVAPLGAAA
jgi:hypothetical protein